MNINKLNAGQICSIKSYTNAYSNHYKYKKSIKIFGFTLRKEGYYYTLVIGEHIFMTPEEIESDGEFFCKNEKVYYKPHLEIKMSNECVFNKFFNSEAELIAFMETDVMKNVNWI